MNVSANDTPSASITVGNSSIHVKDLGNGEFTLAIRSVSASTKSLMLAVTGSMDEKQATSLKITPYEATPGSRLETRPKLTIVVTVPSPPS